jgi:hypothetical protein
MEDNGIIMAAEPSAAYTATTYNGVMGYLHRIRLTSAVKELVARRLLVEVTSPDLAKTFARLDHLSQLQSDWDGHGARRISYAVIDNLRDVLLISDNEDWKYWMISPAPNGSLSLQSKRHTASISVGDMEFSYYSSNGDTEEGESHLKFTPDSFLNVMRRIV